MRYDRYMDRWASKGLKVWYSLRRQTCVFVGMASCVWHWAENSGVHVSWKTANLCLSVSESLNTVYPPFAHDFVKYSTVIKFHVLTSALRMLNYMELLLLCIAAAVHCDRLMQWSFAQYNTVHSSLDTLHKRGVGSCMGRVLVVYVSCVGHVLMAYWSCICRVFVMYLSWIGHV